MSFHSPNNLYFLFALLAPIIIHLINLRKPKKIYFSSIYFLKEIKKKNKNYSKLNDLLLLLVRLLSLFFIVLSFSMPYISSNKSSENKRIKIVIDNSLSMSSSIDNVRKIDIAKNYAYKTANSIKNKIALITINNKTDFEDNETINERIRLIDFENQEFKIDKIINDNDSLKFEYIIFTDLQFNAEDLLNIDNKKIVNIVPILDNKNANITIDTCWINNINYNSNFLELNVKFRNNSNINIENLPAFLFIDNKQTTQSLIKLEQHSDSVIMFNFPIEDTITSGHIQIYDDSYQFDNILFFNIKKYNISKLLLISDDLEDKFISKYLDKNYFNLKIQNSRNSIEDIFKYNAVILSDINEFNDEYYKNILKYVSNGGNVFISISNTSKNKLLKKIDIDIKNWVDQKLIINEINYDHPVLKNIFEEKITKNLDIATTDGYLEIKSKNYIDYILKLENNKPFLFSKKYLKGNFFIITSGLNQNSFFSSNLFAPILYNICNNFSHESYYNLDNKYYLLNESIGSKPISIENENSEIKLISKKQYGKYTIMPTTNVIEAGNYLLNLEDNSSSKISFNYNRKESKFYPNSIQNLKSLIKTKKSKNIKLMDYSSKEKIEFNNSDKEYWKICLIFALLFFLLEILIIKIIENEYIN